MTVSGWPGRWRRSVKLTVERVETLEQAQELRHLRNECRAWMTRDQRIVSGPAQKGFYGSQIVSGASKAWLLRHDGDAVAFGLLRASEGCWWLTCGVAGLYRDRGLGLAVVRLATTAGLDTGLPVKLEVWADNERAVHVYEKAGYAVESETERDGRRLLTMAAS